MLTLLMVTAMLPEAKSQNLSQISEQLNLKTKRPSMVVSAGPSQFSVDSGVADPDAFVDPIVRLGSLLLRSDMTVLRPTILPESNWGILKPLVGASQSTKSTEEVVPGSAIKGGKLVFSSASGSVVSLRTLAPLNLGKQIQLAGYFVGAQMSPFKVAISAPGGVDGVVLAQSLATGLGGKFRVTDTAWIIDFDAASWRRSFSVLLSKAQEGVRKGTSPSSQPEYDPSGGQVYEYQPQMPSLAKSKESRELALSLLSQTVGVLSDSLIEQTFAYSNTTTRLNLNNYPGLKRPIGDFIRSLSEKQSGGATVTRPGQSGATLPPNILSRIDPNRPGELIIETNFRISVELNLKGVRGGDSQEPLKLQIL
ncbi:MAG: hypothetical protein WCK51_13425 [Armatimonadota bacterium]